MLSPPVRRCAVLTGKELDRLKGHEEEVLAVASSPDGKTLATGSADWTVKLWEVDTLMGRAVLKGHRGFFCS